MKKFFLSFCLLTSLVFLFTQCSKDNTTSAPAATANYSPLTVGSNWTYNFVDGSSSGTQILTVTDKDTSINGKSYKVLSNSDSSGNNYLAKIDSNYYRFASFAGIGSIEELYLKDNRGVGSTWTNTVPFTLPGSPVSLTANLTYTIAEAGTTRTVNGKDYKDVIHVNVVVNVLSVNFGGGDFYYANNVGLIESSIKLTPSTQTTYTSSQQLVSYEIK